MFMQTIVCIQSLKNLLHEGCLHHWWWSSHLGDLMSYYGAGASSGVESTRSKLYGQG